MKRFLSVLLSFALVFAFLPGCSTRAASGGDAGDGAEHLDSSLMNNLKTDAGSVEFSSLDDPDLSLYIQDSVYEELLASLDTERYFINNVEAVYYSQEYLDDLASNTQANTYFGYKIADIESAFLGERYVFTLGENGQTVVQAFERYDDALDQVMQNVAVGTGVILVCVTVSAVSAGAALPAVSAIFAVSAKTGAIAALSTGGISGLEAGICTGLETGDFDEALKAAALAGSEGYVLGAIAGAVAGGAGEALVLRGATSAGLSANQAALIQRESGYPLDVIKGLETMGQYGICKDAGLAPKMVAGRTALARNIDLEYVDEMGRTNLERMREGLAALDPKTGKSYELHHIGQNNDSTLAILSQEEHRMGDNHKIWHKLDESDVDHGSKWTKQRKEFWKAMAASYV